MRPISDLDELYHQFGTYRLHILQERIKAMLTTLREARTGHQPFPTESIKRFLEAQEAFVAHTNREIVEKHLVISGHLTELDH